MTNKAVQKIILELSNTIVEDFYHELYVKLQSLGGPGLHSENEINRQDVLDVLKEARKKFLDSTD